MLWPWQGKHFSTPVYTHNTHTAYSPLAQVQTKQTERPLEFHFKKSVTQV